MYVLEQDIDTAIATAREWDADAFTLYGFTYSGRGSIIIVFDYNKIGRFTPEARRWLTKALEEAKQ